MRGFFGGAAIAVVIVGVSGGFASARSPQATTDLDRTLQKVYGTAIMTSDVREARLLKLVPEASAGDEAVQRALENRLLILRELTRLQPVDPGRDAVAARRQAWTSSWPAGTDLPALMAKCGTTDQALDGWFRGELQIATFLAEKFGGAGDPGREAKYNEWIGDLRKRANLR